MKTKIMHVESNSFVGKDGKQVEYCKFDIIDKIDKEKDKVGFVISSMTTKINHFNKLAELCTTNKEVDIEIEFVANPNGTYKRKPIKIDDYIL